MRILQFWSKLSLYVILHHHFRTTVLCISVHNFLLCLCICRHVPMRIEIELYSGSRKPKTKQKLWESFNFSDWKTHHTRHFSSPIIVHSQNTLANCHLDGCVAENWFDDMQDIQSKYIVHREYNPNNILNYFMHDKIEVSIKTNGRLSLGIGIGIGMEMEREEMKKRVCKWDLEEQETHTDNEEETIENVSSITWHKRKRRERQRAKWIKMELNWVIKI